MKGKNSISIIGNLGKDATCKEVGEKNTPIAEFSLAATTYIAGQEHTEWFNCVIIGRLAAAVGPYLVKGKQVAVDGALRTRSWEDEDGDKHYRTEVVVSDILLLGGNGNGNGKTTETDHSRTTGAANTDPFGFDEIPF